jgi:hypothetical protein
VWILLGTFYAFLVFDVVDLIFRTLFADIISIIKVFRMEALDTFGAVIVVQRVLALTYTFG